MLSFPSQNDKKKNVFPTGQVHSKKQTRVTANHPTFKPGFINCMFKTLSVG